MKTRSLLFTLILFILITYSNAKELEKVSLQLSWFNQFQFAGYYMAKKKGFYEDVGFDVDIRNFDFGIDVVQEVTNGKADFGIGRETLLLEKSKNNQIISLYALFQASPLVLISTKESKINTVKDFVGKKIMTTIDDAGEVSLKAMISSHNIDVKELNFIKHSHNILDLVNKKTDVISAYISKSPYDLMKLGMDYNIFYPKDFGFDMYSDFLFTSENEIKNNEQKVIDFRNASLKGWKYAFDNIEETVNFILENYNEQKISKDALIYEGEELKKLAFLNNSKLGEIKESKLQRIIDLYKVMGLLQKPINAKSFMYKNHYNLFTKRETKYLKNLDVISICVNSRNHEYNGILTDVLGLFQEKINFKYKFIYTDNLNKSLNFLKTRQCDISSFIDNSTQLPESISFTNSFMDVPLVFATKQDVSFINDIYSLRNKKIGVVQNATFLKVLRDKFPTTRFIEVNNISEGLRDLKKDKYFAFIGSIVNISNEIENDYITNLKISGKLNEDISYSLAVLKDRPILANILNKSLSLISEFEKQKVINKWMLLEYEKNFDYSILLKMLIFVVIIFFALIYRQLLLNKLNKTLKIKVKYKTKQLQKLNENLEKRIKKEVEENRRKDRLLSQQIKMAAMGEMLENIAHQWRQPLSVISTTATGVKIQKENNMLTDKFLLKSLDSINETSQYLSKTIEDFRSYYEPNKKMVIFNIKELYEKTLKVMDSKYKAINIKIIENIQSVDLVGLDSELVQVIINILNNSKDALDNDKEIRRRFIFVDIYTKNDFLVILIKDNAGGIDENIMNRIFEPYFTTKHKSQGTGIGLYMSKEIIEKHMYGIIEVDNSEYFYRDIEYKGAQFKIKVPINLENIKDKEKIEK